MAGIEPAIVAPLPAKWIGMRQGDGRNRALWERCMRPGAGCGLDRMMEIARDANQSFKEPLMDADHGPDHLRWFWSFTLHGPMTRSDRAATLEEAKAQFQKSWDAWKAWAKMEEAP